MSGKLAVESRQPKAFSSLEEEAYLNLGHTWEFLQSRVSGLLKEWGLTPTQYNMLRILRGAGKDGLTCSQACERMITAESDITRLIERMQTRGLVNRAKSEEDRRVVMVRISQKGLELAKEIDRPMKAMTKRHLSQLGKKKLEKLVNTLELLRTQVVSPA